MSTLVLDAPGFSFTGSVARNPRVYTSSSGGALQGATPSQILQLLGIPNAAFGTGSDIVSTLAGLAARRSSGSWVSSISDRAADTYIEQGMPVSQIVNTIRKCFAFTVTDLASVLGVERPTIYSWLKDQSKPSPERLQRMGRVLRIADIWTAETDGTVKPDLSAATAGGIELFVALKEPKLWENEILLALNAQASTSARSVHRSRLSVMARKRGIDLRPTSDFDVATGRPLGQEEL